MGMGGYSALVAFEKCVRVYVWNFFYIRQVLLFSACFWLGGLRGCLI